MKASELIELCDAHPKAMERIGVELRPGAMTGTSWLRLGEWTSVYVTDTEAHVDNCRDVIGYRLTDWCDEHDITIDWLGPIAEYPRLFGWRRISPMGKRDTIALCEHRSRLEALLSACESSAVEVSP